MERTTNICKDGVATSPVVGAGTEPKSTDWTGGCVGAYEADVSGSQIVVSSFESGNYDYAGFHLHVNAGPVITGVFFAGYTPNFFQPGIGADDTNLLPAISFDDDDIFITWDSSGAGTQFVFNGPANGGQDPFGAATFNVTTADRALPVPPTAALMGLALALMAGLRRRHTRPTQG